MAERGNRDLLHRSLTPRQSHRIIFGSEVPDPSGHPLARLQLRERFLQKRSLSRARARDQADDKHSRRAELFAQRASDHVVLLQNISAYSHQAQNISCLRAGLRTRKQLNGVQRPPRLALRTKHKDVFETIKRDPCGGLSWHATSYENSTASLTTPESAPSRRCTALTCTVHRCASSRAA